MSEWRKRAQSLIRELVKDLPDDAPLADRKKALWGKGYPAHGDTSWGKKMWGDEVRKYLQLHGAVRKVTKIVRTSPITGKREVIDLTQLNLFGVARHG